MIKTKLTAVIAICILFAIACSPEIKLQNILTKDGGRWNIDEVRINSTTQVDPPIYTETVADNMGEIIFFESGTGVWIGLDTALDVEVARYFEYENTGNTILINFDNTLEQEYSIEQKSKDEQIWTREETLVDPITSANVIVNTQITISRVNEVKNK